MRFKERNCRRNINVQRKQQVPMEKLQQLIRKIQLRSLAMVVTLNKFSG